MEEKRDKEILGDDVDIFCLFCDAMMVEIGKEITFYAII